jgi:imidazolonepropionase-like amidohydrolase
MGGIFRRLAAASFFAIATATVVTAQQPYAPPVQVEQSDTITAFVGVTVVPMDSPRVLPNQTVIVRGEHIAEIGPARQVHVPATARRIDAHNSSLIPGLVDMHVHLMEGERYLPLLLANGVTTVRNMAGGPQITSLRERIQNRTLLGPNIYTAGPLVDGSPPVWPGSDVVTTGEQARKLVEAQKNAGYDFLKVYDNLQPAAYEAIMKSARQLHMPVAGHVPPQVGLQRVLDAHQHSIEHLTGYFEWLQTKQSPFQQGNNNEIYRHPAHLLAQRQALVDWLDESRIPQIASATAKAGTWNVPTLVAWRNMKRREDIDSAWKSPAMQYATPMLRNWWNSANEYTQENFAAKQRGDAARNKILKALHDAGARILVGTDTPHPFVMPGFSVHEELANFVAAGLSPYEALRAATADAAEFLGAAREFGRVKVGARADLVLVMGNPLEDVGNARRIVGVMVRGVWLSRDDLRRGLNTVPQTSSKGVNE